MARNIMLSCLFACIFALELLHVCKLTFAGIQPHASMRGSVAVKSLAIGSAMPDISLPNQNGQTVSISSFKSEEGGPFGFGAKEGKPVVLFLFAGSASPSCTKQAQAFRDRYAEFQLQGAEVIGISKDSVEFQKDWKEKEALPFNLLTDKDGSVRESLGIPKDLFGLLEGRQTYVVGTDGKVKMIFNDQFGPEKHIDAALAAL